MRLSIPEARAARQRRIEYEHNMAIEGMFLSDEDRRILDYVDAQRMGYEEGVRYVVQQCIKEGLISDRFQAIAAE